MTDKSYPPLAEIIYNRFTYLWRFTRVPSVLKSTDLSVFKAGPVRLKQLTNTLKIRILSETSILYLIRYASVILIVGLHL